MHGNMIDPRCAKLKKETAHMTETQANVHFCTMSETAKEVFKDELRFVRGTDLKNADLYFHLPKKDSGNHWHMCKRFHRY